MATFSEEIEKQVSDINMILESDFHPGIYIYDFISGQQKPIDERLFELKVKGKSGDPIAKLLLKRNIYLHGAN